MKIREFKKRDIKTISNEDLRTILGTSFNNQIIKQIQEEFLIRENGL